MIHIFDEGLYPKYPEALQSSNTKTYNPISDVENSHFTKKDIKTASKHMNKCSKSFRKCKLKPQRNIMSYP